MKYLFFLPLFACSLTYGQYDITEEEQGFFIVDPGEEGKMRAECLPIELEKGTDSCRFVIREGYNLRLLYQFDNAYNEKKTYKDRDDSFLRRPIQITFFDKDSDEGSSFETTSSKLDYTNINGKDAVYLDFSNPRITTNFKFQSFVMLEFQDKVYFFDISGYETAHKTVYEAMK